MSTPIAAEKTIWTCNTSLDNVLPHLTWGELEKLADYAKYLR